MLLYKNMWKSQVTTMVYPCSLCTCYILWLWLLYVIYKYSIVYTAYGSTANFLFKAYRPKKLGSWTLYIDFQETVYYINIFLSYYCCIMTIN